MIETILLTTTPVSTFAGQRGLTHATGLFFQRDDRLFLVTSRHVLRDAPTDHFPHRIEIELHTDAENVAASYGVDPALPRSDEHLMTRSRSARRS